MSYLIPVQEVKIDPPSLCKGFFCVMKSPHADLTPSLYDQLPPIWLSHQFTVLTNYPGDILGELQLPSNREYTIVVIFWRRTSLLLSSNTLSCIGLSHLLVL